MVNGVPTTVLTNVTTVRDASGKIVNTYYSSNNVGDQLSSSSNLDGSTRSKTHKQTKKTNFNDINSEGGVHKSKIIYTSTGGGKATQGGENLSISGRTEEETIQSKSSSKD